LVAGVARHTARIWAGASLPVFCQRGMSLIAQISRTEKRAAAARPAVLSLRA
jgi:hypothetical protein